MAEGDFDQDESSAPAIGQENDRGATSYDKVAMRSSRSPNPEKNQSVKLSSVAAFCVFLCANLLASAYAPIQDCDEVFNYWEPTHYIAHGFGLQTWEYSPEYAIRSWLYALIHAIPSKIAAIFVPYKALEFYIVRGVLGFICAACETRLFLTISRTMNPRIAVIFLTAMVSSSGMFYASVAYLPSSFAMYAAMMGSAAFLGVKDGLKTTEGIMWFGIGATVGWPFSAALILPFVPDELVSLKRTGDVNGAVSRVFGGVMRTAAIVSLQLAVDLLFYGKVVFVPWRIVSYNVLSGSSRGPDIFGTEPWHFYIRNLLLNFNAWFLLAMCAGPLLGLQLLLNGPSLTRRTILRSMMICSPFYMWFAIFSAQSHKEERFMYPAYPFLCLNAAIALHTVLNYSGHLSPRGITGKTPAAVKLALVSTFALAIVVLGVLRTVGTVSAYSAPLEIYKLLQTPEYAYAQGNVCLGKEWYRFPSSYFLPKNMRLKFVKSAFDGLLPGEFSEAGTDSGILPTWLIPTGMNDQNIEDPGKHIDIGQCSFLVDSFFSGSGSSMLEPNYISDGKNWEQIQCHQFLDSSQTRSLGRIIWIPEWKFIPARFRRQWAKYCLLRRKSATGPLIATNARQFLYAGIVAVLFAWLVAAKLIKRNKSMVPRESSPDLEKPTSSKGSTRKAPERTPGVWPPVEFVRPTATPYPAWDVHETDPLPYRPFRHGPYHITMGLRTMQWDDWIELDNHYLKYHADKARRIEEKGDKCCRTAPEAYDGAVELLEELRDYLPQRYPTLFQKTDVGISNLATDESFNTVERPLHEDPMAMCARLVQDDLAIMFEKSDGQYYLLAGSILLAGFWRLSDKFGMPLSEIHTSGDVPGFKTKLEKGMLSFFRRIKCENPVLRNNYFIQVDDDLAWSHSIGAEDGDGTQAEGWGTAAKDKAIEQHYFRSERQSLRRLPRSGGVVFTIRTYFEPVTAIAREPGVPGRLASAVRSWGDDVSKYKGREKYQKVLLEYLDREHKRQLEDGVIIDSEEHGGYPF